MNKFIFFLIPILFLSIIPLADAQIEKGYNYDKELIQTFPDGSQEIKWTNQPNRVYDGNNWVPYYQFGNIIIADVGSVSLNDNGSYNWNGKFDDRIIGKYADISDLNSWTYLNTLNADTPENSFVDGVFTSSKLVTGLGQLDYKYVFTNGQWKTQLEATNLTPLTTKVFGFDQIIDLESDSIMFGGIQRNLDNFDGVTFDKTFLDNNEGKVLDLLNGVNFDFDLGYENLYSITVYDTGINKSQLIFDYRTSEVLLPGETLIIDPTFNGAHTAKGRLTSSGTGTTCPAYGANSAVYLVMSQASTDAGNGACSIEYFQFDLSSLSAPFSIISAEIEFDVTNQFGSPTECDLLISSTNTLGATMYDEGVAYGGAQTAEAIANEEWINCNDATANDYIVTIDSSAFAVLESKIGGTVTFLAAFDDMTRDGVSDGTYMEDFNLTIVYSIIPAPDGVDDLISTNIDTTTVNLAWTEPNLNTGNLTGYQINYTTPWSQSVNTIITNNTGNSDVTTQVTGLSELTQYSFRLGVWTEGSNMTGNILNLTTIEDFTLANFTPGFFDVNATNTNIIQIFFERININSTALFLNVTYPNTYSLACDFSYQFANINQTYTNLSNVTVSTNAVESSFQFVDVDNEIIDVYCWNENNLDNDGSYIITQTSFPLLQQISNFRDGTYGTQGDFGAFDFITLAVVIISMIGFNRVNESVGAIFNIIFLGSLAFFEIIELPTIIFGAIAVVIMLVIATTRKP